MNKLDLVIILSIVLMGGMLYALFWKWFMMFVTVTIIVGSAALLAWFNE